MPATRPTVRSLAAELGLSRSTVSNALRGLPGVNAETRRRVQAAADASGYRTHPFAARVMSQLRRGAKARHVGTLAILEMHELARPRPADVFHRDLIAGIKKRAGEIGFTITHIKFGGSSELSLKRIDEILQSRGIKGIVLLPTWSDADFLALNWKRYAGVYLDYSMERPTLHTVCSDHFRSLVEALNQARARGYRKIGFTIARRSNQRLHGRWIGAFFGYMHAHPELTAAPLLEVDELAPENFSPWFRQHDPDVVITHWIGAARCMIAAGAKIPKTHGLICLNLQPAAPGTSGFDLQPRLLGARAAESVIAQLERDEQSPPAFASTTVVPARWVEGTTIAACGDK